MADRVSVAYVEVVNNSTNPPTVGQGLAAEPGCAPESPNSCNIALEEAARIAVANAGANSPDQCLLVYSNCVCQEVPVSRQPGSGPTAIFANLKRKDGVGNG